MISTNEAKVKIDKVTTIGKNERIDLLNGLGQNLSQDIFSPIDLPQFDQSAMDGFAVKLGKGNRFRVVGEIQAGDSALGLVLKENEAVKIFTGALCPDSADLVCRIEDVVIEDNNEDIEIQVMPKLAANIRKTGEQIKKGDFALAKCH